MAGLERCMDKRNSKDNMLERIRYLEAQCEALYDAGLSGISHVGQANYAEREAEAIGWVSKAYWNFTVDTNADSN